MCGRFAHKDKSWAELCEMYELASMPAELPLFPRYNIAPTQQVLAVREGSVGRKAAMLRWGLVPSWSKGFKSGPPVINARAETLADKPTFRAACRKRRCLFRADGFYEWQRSSKLSGENFSSGSQAPHAQINIIMGGSKHGRRLGMFNARAVDRRGTASARRHSSAPRLQWP